MEHSNLQTQNWNPFHKTFFNCMTRPHIWPESENWFSQWFRNIQIYKNQFLLVNWWIMCRVNIVVSITIDSCKLRPCKIGLSRLLKSCNMKVTRYHMTLQQISLKVTKKHSITTQSWLKLFLKVEFLVHHIFMHQSSLCTSYLDLICNQNYMALEFQG